MKRIKIIKSRVAALVMSFFLALGFITPAFNITAKAEAVEVLNGTSTVADVVLAYYTTVGAGITNIDWINTLSRDLGTNFGTVESFVNNGYLIQDSSGAWTATEAFVNAIENTGAYTQLGLNDVFNVSAEQVANGGGAAVATGGSILAASMGSVATVGAVPLFVGVTASYWAGIGVGTLISNLLQKYVPSIYTGIPSYGMDNTDVVFQNSYPGGSCAYISQRLNGDTVYTYYLFPNTACVSGTITNNQAYLKCYCKLSNQYYKVIQYSGTVNTNGLLINRQTNILNGSTVLNGYFPNQQSTLGAVNNFLSNFSSSSETTVTNTNRSPDIVGSDGNAQANYDPETGQYNVPSFTPNVDPDTQAVKPIPVAEYYDFAQQANNNTQNGNYPDNGSLFDDLIYPYIMPLPSPSPDPDPDPNPDPDPDPYPDPNPDPETVPVTVPTVNPYPESYPVPDPDTVPDNKPQPEYTEKATENETDIIEGDPYTTPDLLNKFPFCIPRDILKVFKKLDSGARQAPHIQWRFHPNNMIDYTFDIDFATWDSVATLLRILELAAFIIALGIATRNLILS